MGQGTNPEVFGKYLILDHLVDGGMAKVSRARFLDEKTNKVVAVKTIKPNFSQDPAFREMFMEEIKTTFGLSHPNIVQTFDYGYHGDSLFVVMEYCDGYNLNFYAQKLKERNFIFPLQVSAFIISQACQALNYAHNFTDNLSGKKLNIIHRDISPHNIMLTFEGVLKIIDFGIAKSNESSDFTESGTLRGKVSYLAPEYIEGKSIDHRYDQFALGITLWEMLTGKRLFNESNNIATIKKIQECEIAAPSKYNKKVPLELDAIVLKALNKDPAHRFENMDQFGRALLKFLNNNFPNFNPQDIKKICHELFKNEIATDRQKLVTFGKMDISKYLSSEGSKNPSKESTKAAVKKPELKNDLETGNWNFEIDKTQVETIGNEIVEDKPAPRRQQKLSIEETKTNTQVSRSSLYKELEERDRVSTEDVVVYAPVAQRGIGLIIDVAFDVGIFFSSKFLIPITKFIVSIPMDKYGFVWSFDPKTMTKAYWGIDFFMLFSLCVFFPTLFYNTSLGKRVMNLRVRDIGQYTLSLEQAFMREFVYKPISVLSLIGIIVPFFNKERRSLHDFLAKTQVVVD